MDDLELLLDLHLGGRRQGPGSEEATSRAIDLSGLRGATGLAIADIGCGSGASTLVLAEQLDARITAVDLFPDFLSRLDTEAVQRGLSDRITTTTMSMDALDFVDGSLDAIWSEGAIYNIGFERGIRTWRRFLRVGAILAVSELTWLTSDRPAELEAYWRSQYPEVDTASAKIGILERSGYSPIGYFTLPASCWLDEYHRPLQDRLGEFLARHQHSDAARAIVAAEEREIDLFERFSTHVGYGFYVARRLPG